MMLSPETTLFDSIARMGLLTRQAIDGGLAREVAIERATAAAWGLSFLDKAKPAIAPIISSVGLAWLESAFATLELAPCLAASLAATRLPKEYAQELRLPWRAFRVRVPAGVFCESSASILVIHTRNGSGPMFTITHGLGTCTVGEEPSLASFLDTGDFEWTTPPMCRDFTAGELDERARLSHMLHSLVVGCCVEMATRGSVGPPPAWRPHHGAARADEPRVWRFQVKRRVKVDARAAVAAYVSGGGSHPKVQSLVRGHHKRQPHGAGGSLRKWIHVEPYWRGPEDAPIAVRAHALGGA